MDVSSERRYADVMKATTFIEKVGGKRRSFSCADRMQREHGQIRAGSHTEAAGDYSIDYPFALHKTVFDPQIPRAKRGLKDAFDRIKHEAFGILRANPARRKKSGH